MRTASRIPQQEEPQDPWWLWRGIAIGVTAGLTAALVSSCNPRVIEHIQRDTIYTQRVQVDSIYCHDSVYIREKGDTFYIYKEQVRDRYIFRRDTIRVVKADSVLVERVKEVEVEKPLSWWKTAKIRAFWGLVVAVLLLGLWTFRKPLINLIR